MDVLQLGDFSQDALIFQVTRKSFLPMQNRFLFVLPCQRHVAGGFFQLGPCLTLGRPPFADNFLRRGHIVRLQACFNECRPCPVMAWSAL